MRNQFIGNFHEFFVDFFIIFGVIVPFDNISGIGPSLKGFGVLFGPIKIAGHISVRIDMMIVIDSTIDLDGLLE